MSESEAGAYLIERVRHALATDPRVNELGIVVTIVERKVFLHGTVATVERSQHITEVVREVLPDHDVHNEVAVDTPTAPRASEQMR
jgi:osmotically-inducible protein OsmY